MYIITTTPMYLAFDYCSGLRYQLGYTNLRKLITVPWIKFMKHGSNTVFIHHKIGHVLISDWYQQLLTKHSNEGGQVKSWWCLPSLPTMLHITLYPSWCLFFKWLYKLAVLPSFTVVLLSYKDNILVGPLSMGFLYHHVKTTYFHVCNFVSSISSASHSSH